MVDSHQKKQMPLTQNNAACNPTINGLSIRLHFLMKIKSPRVIVITPCGFTQESNDILAASFLYADPFSSCHDKVAAEVPGSVCLFQEKRDTCLSPDHLSQVLSKISFHWFTLVL